MVENTWNSWDGRKGDSWHLPGGQKAFPPQNLGALSVMSTRNGPGCGAGTCRMEISQFREVLQSQLGILHGYGTTEVFCSGENCRK